MNTNEKSPGGKVGIFPDPDKTYKPPPRHIRDTVELPRDIPRTTAAPPPPPPAADPPPPSNHAVDKPGVRTLVRRALRSTPSTIDELMERIGDPSLRRDVQAAVCKLVARGEATSTRRDDSTVYAKASYQAPEKTTTPATDVVLSHLTDTPQVRGQIAEKCGMSADRTSAALNYLARHGFAKRLTEYSGQHTGGWVRTDSAPKVAPMPPRERFDGDGFPSAPPIKPGPFKPPEPVPQPTSEPTDILKIVAEARDMALELARKADFIEAFNALADDIHATAIAKGMWDDLDRARQVLNDAGLDDIADDLIIARCAVMAHSELSELVEYQRVGGAPDKHLPQFDARVVELADAVMRLMDTARKRNWPLGEAIIAKLQYNKSRPRLHGKRF